MNNVFLFANVPLFFLHRERSAAANRMSHIFGLTGPTSTAETAWWEPRVPSESLAEPQTSNMSQVRHLWWLWELRRWPWGDAAEIQWENPKILIMWSWFSMFFPM